MLVLANALRNELEKVITGTLNYTYVNRLRTLHLATHYASPLDYGPVLISPQAGVDGSRKEKADGTIKAAGSACYYAYAPGQTRAAAHIITCIFQGEQTVANAECSGYSTQK
jgi:hypothetical protein